MRLFTFALSFLFLSSVLFANTPVANLVFSNPQEGTVISFVVSDSPSAEAYSETANRGQLDCRYIPSGKYGYFKVDHVLLNSVAKVYGISGKLLSSFILNNTEVPTDLRNGIYLVKVINKSGVYNQKIIL